MKNVTRTLEHDWWPKELPPNVAIGERTWLHSAFAFAHYRSVQDVGVRIGHDTGVYINTLFDLGPSGTVEIGNYCTIVGLIVASNGRTKIGDHSFVAHDVVIADSPIAVPPGSRASASSQEGSADIVLGENVWIGARVALLPGADIGEGAIVGAATVVDFPVPPFAVVAGDPPRIVGYAQTSTREDNDRKSGRDHGRDR